MKFYCVPLISFVLHSSHPLFQMFSMFFLISSKIIFKSLVFCYKCWEKLIMWFLDFFKQHNFFWKELEMSYYYLLWSPLVSYQPIFQITWGKTWLVFSRLPKDLRIIISITLKWEWLKKEGRQRFQSTNSIILGLSYIFFFSQSIHCMKEISEMLIISNSSFTFEKNKSNFWHLSVDISLGCKIRPQCSLFNKQFHRIPT